MAESSSDLTSRVLPIIKLGSGEPPSQKLAPDRNLPITLTNDPCLKDPYLRLQPVVDATPAYERFRVSGTAIVTGGAGDLGIAAIRALLEHGLQTVVLFDAISPEAIANAKRELSDNFPYATFVYNQLDITDADAVKLAVDGAAQLFGPITVLANFVGVVCCEHAKELSVDAWRRTMDVNATGSFIIAQAVARKMAEAKTGGSIILVASISGSRVNFPQPQAAYNASKAAVIMMKNCLAVEWARHGIRVNTISPGYMNTILNEGEGLEEARKAWFARNPMGRIGEREEICGALVLLASRAGSYITGADIVVDGGQSLL
ncbi:hypothetical protein QBC40DRAFT_274718 [Triangularia verruculosa]|uniref:NAD(P)-binding protein n=1 Tax=Triangularia verruculosa TaxID=2587418 RepID=A0AAN6XM97_9PEZI|nr:hypothetical protein QBC40DRAFT_274718 [Triangularia verruculosa]